MTSSLRIYFHPVSQPSRSVLMFCKLANIQFEPHIVNIFEGAQKLPEYLTVNPHGKVPAIVDGDFKLAESVAIIQYLADSRHHHALFPQDVNTRARINEWMNWHHHGARKSTTEILVPTLRQHDAQKIEESKNNFKSNVLEFLNNHLANHRFLVGNDMTIADLLLLPELDQLEIVGIMNYDSYHHLRRYLTELIGAIPCYEEVAAFIKGMAEQQRKKT